jgi:hypothetical protein
MRAWSSGDHQDGDAQHNTQHQDDHHADEEDWRTAGSGIAKSECAGRRTQVVAVEARSVLDPAQLESGSRKELAASPPSQIIPPVYMSTPCTALDECRVTVKKTSTIHERQVSLRSARRAPSDESPPTPTGETRLPARAILRMGPIHDSAEC